MASSWTTTIFASIATDPRITPEAQDFGADDGSNPPEVWLIPASSTSLGRLVGIDPATGGYWFFDWRVLVRVQALFVLPRRLSVLPRFMV